VIKQAFLDEFRSSLNKILNKRAQRALERSPETEGF